MEKITPYMVALSPAILAALICLHVNTSQSFVKYLLKTFDKPIHLENWRENINAAAWLGTTAAALVANEETILYWTLVCGWFVVLQFGSFCLSNRIIRMTEMAMQEEFSTRHRKMAGAVRSIVRSELDKTETAKAGIEKPLAVSDKNHKMEA